MSQIRRWGRGEIDNEKEFEDREDEDEGKEVVEGDIEDEKEEGQQRDDEEDEGVTEKYDWYAIKMNGFLNTDSNRHEKGEQQKGTERKEVQSYLQAAQVGGCSSICMMKGG